ncbi:hypothetical protein B0H11DRAFT_46590 [Mycena galericulata]|nr:hypothetical protein B0H11DRAFT_46590 [Mycena galericulata]
MRKSVGRGAVHVHGHLPRTTLRSTRGSAMERVGLEYIFFEATPFLLFISSFILGDPPHENWRRSIIRCKFAGEPVTRGEQGTFPSFSLVPERAIVPSHVGVAHERLLITTSQVKGKFQYKHPGNNTDNMDALRIQFYASPAGPSQSVQQLRLVDLGVPPRPPSARCHCHENFHLC